MYVYERADNGDEIRSWAKAPAMASTILEKLGACSDAREVFHEVASQLGLWTSNVPVTVDTCLRFQEEARVSHWGWAARTLLQERGYERFKARVDRVWDRYCWTAGLLQNLSAERERAATTMEEVDRIYALHLSHMNMLARYLGYQYALIFAACYHSYARYDYRELYQER